MSFLIDTCHNLFPAPLPIRITLIVFILHQGQFFYGILLQLSSLITSSYMFLTF